MRKMVLLFLFISISVNSQQITFTQPAVKDSNQKLDSVYCSSLEAIRSSDLYDPITEKWYATEYDSDKNPTKFDVNLFNPYSSSPLMDSLKIEIEHHDFRNYISDFRNKYINSFDLQDNSYSTEHDVTHIFNVKTITLKEFNTVNNEWELKMSNEYLNDSRLPELVSSYRLIRDSNNVITNINKVEGQVELNGLGYLNEKLYYSWNSIDGFTPSTKHEFQNIYDSENKLIESVRSKFTFATNEDEILSKTNFSYSTSLFSYTIQNWNMDNLDWDAPHFKLEIDYVNGNPITRNRFDWDGTDWVLIHDDITIDNTQQNYFFNTLNLFTGYSYHTPFENKTFSIGYDQDNLLVSENFDSVYNLSDSTASSQQKEFYYSSDSNLISIDDFTNEEISIYPNPSSDYLKIDTDLTLDYKIYSVQGKLIKQGTIIEKIDIADLSKGIYFIEANNNDKHMRSQFIKK